MPYIERDENRKIKAIHKLSQTEDGQDDVPSENFEEMDSTTNEVLQFLLPDEWLLGQEELLQKTDLSMVRVVEDLVSVLIEKNVIQFTDLPQAAVNKIMLRRNLRKKLDNIGGILT